MDHEEREFLANGGVDAVAELFRKYRPQLERMVDFRLDRRLYGRVDPADILQESYLEVSKRIEDFLTRTAIDMCGHWSGLEKSWSN